MPKSLVFIKNVFRCILLQNKMGAEHDELMRAIQAMDEKLNKRMDNIETIIGEFKNLKKDFLKLEKTHEIQAKELSTVKSELNTIKQHLLDSDIIIIGVPDTITEKSVFDTVNTVLMQLKAKITVADVKSCFRMRNKNNISGSSPICVELYSKTLRAAIFDHQKRIGPVLLSTVDRSVVAADKRKIFIQKRLTPFYQDLLASARQFKVENNWKFVWVQNTDVLLKETDSSRIIKIQTKADLLALGKQ